MIDMICKLNDWVNKIEWVIAIKWLLSDIKVYNKDYNLLQNADHSNAKILWQFKFKSCSDDQ